MAASLLLITLAHFPAEKKCVYKNEIEILENISWDYKVLIGVRNICFQLNYNHYWYATDENSICIL